MEERVCKNLWKGKLIKTTPMLSFGQKIIFIKGLIRTMPDDNPYEDIDGVAGCSCTPKGDMKTLSCAAKLKEAERKAANAAKREEKKAKKAKQTVEDAE